MPSMLEFMIINWNVSDQSNCNFGSYILLTIAVRVLQSIEPVGFIGIWCLQMFASTVCGESGQSMDLLEITSAFIKISPPSYVADDEFQDQNGRKVRQMQYPWISIYSPYIWDNQKIYELVSHFFNSISRYLLGYGLSHLASYVLLHISFIQTVFQGCFLATIYFGVQVYIELMMIIILLKIYWSRMSWTELSSIARSNAHYRLHSPVHANHNGIQRKARCEKAAISRNGHQFIGIITFFNCFPVNWWRQRHFATKMEIQQL